MYLSSVLPRIAPFSPGADEFYPGDYFSVTCSIISGDLPLKIFWEHNAHRLESSSWGVSIAKTGSRSSVLTIESIKAEHAGNYTCLAANNAGATNVTTNLVVNGLS